jgi:acyl-coenzyme A thioesterase PaaI-like protein
MTVEEVSAFLESVFPGAPEIFGIEEVRENGARVRLLFDEFRLRPGGTISGPSLMTLADTGMWIALLGMIGPEALSVTSSLHIDFLRKPGPRDVISETELLKLGKRLAVGAVTMWSDGEDQPCAHATVTYAIPSSYRG